MRFKVDENLPGELAEALRDAGWDCLSVVEQRLGGADDPKIEQVCIEEARSLPNRIRDSSSSDCGNQSKPRVLAIAERVIDWLRQRDSRNELWIVEEDRIRVRGGAGPDSLILAR